MSYPGFAAIQYPTQWPPPELPPFPRHPLSWVPLIGRLFQYFRWLHYSSVHQRLSLDPIAEEIIAQLETRPTDGPWPTTPEEKLLAKIISDAVGLEKGLRYSPALHPDDPFPLLFWGPYDDITPWIVRTESREKLNREIPGHIVINAWNERWTIQRFIAQSLKPTSSRKHAG